MARQLMAAPIHPSARSQITFKGNNMYITCKHCHHKFEKHHIHCPNCQRRHENESITYPYNLTQSSSDDSSSLPDISIFDTPSSTTDTSSPFDGGGGSFDGGGASGDA